MTNETCIFNQVETKSHTMRPGSDLLARPFA